MERSMGLQQSCKRCGSCCKEGGPALHTADLPLLESGKIGIDKLITLRRGELVLHPETGELQPASTEIVKIRGKGRSWSCYFYDEQANGCGIYGFRPVACEALKCWDTEKILGMVEKDTLTRFDIVDSPLRDVMREYEQLCPSPDFAYIAENRQNISAILKKELEEMVGADLQFRTRQVKLHQLKLADELFYFGRPLFQLLQPFGARVVEKAMEITLLWD
ncbi:unknown protein [Desulfotalea psychrophila LSv54]|uniref:YkgJ family cysteine cluster protein n=2 Tax=Desulfotalea psychrophila TaxID=84980 RepID=Q6AJC2_DESPS|nr:unknown protein [Desulfotalea psychrophila LSv54]